MDAVSIASPHVQTTIEREVRARRVAAFIGGDPRNDGGDFFRSAQAFGGHTGDDFFEHVGADGFHHVGSDVAGAHGVDGHALAGDPLRQYKSRSTFADTNERRDSFSLSEATSNVLTPTPQPTYQKGAICQNIRSQSRHLPKVCS